MKLMTPKEVSERACISRSLVYALLRQGRLPGLRIGCNGRGKWLVRDDDLEQFLRACKPAEVHQVDEPLVHIK